MFDFESQARYPILNVYPIQTLLLNMKQSTKLFNSFMMENLSTYPKFIDSDGEVEIQIVF